MSCCSPKRGSRVLDEYAKALQDQDVEGAVPKENVRSGTEGTFAGDGPVRLWVGDLRYEPHEFRNGSPDQWTSGGSPTAQAACPPKKWSVKGVLQFHEVLMLHSAWRMLLPCSTRCTPLRWRRS